MLYEYRCRNGHEFEKNLPVADYKTPQQCDICHCEGRRIISLPILKIAQDVCYDSPVTGEPITTMKKRREDLARAGCQPYDPDMKQDTDRYVREKADRLERAVDATVEEAIETMPSHKKERLANELLNGADASPTRVTPKAKPIKTEIAHERN